MKEAVSKEMASFFYISKLFKSVLKFVTTQRIIGTSSE